MSFLRFYLKPKPMKTSFPAAELLLNLSDFTKGERAILSLL